MNRLVRFCLTCVALGSWCLLCPTGFAGIKDTKHNLSASGPGTIKAVTESQVCIFCHTPHNASPAYPLWGHAVTGVEYYEHYKSSSLVSYTSEADAPPIDGISRLCLSCHDGTIALGAIQGNSEIRMNIRFMPPNSPDEFGPNLGTNLSGGHPISIVYDEDLKKRREMLDPNLMQLKWPLIDRDVKLYPTRGGMGVQCSSCHDPHGGKGGSEAPPFWRKLNYEDVCLVCHDTYDQTGHGL